MHTPGPFLFTRPASASFSRQSLGEGAGARPTGHWPPCAGLRNNFASRGAGAGGEVARHDGANFQPPRPCRQNSA